MVNQWRRVLAVKRATILGLVQAFGVQSEHRVERIGETGHLPGDATRLAYERADHGVADAGGQRYLWMSV